MKKRKNKGRAPLILPTYSHMELMLASPTRPLPEEQITHQLNRMNSGLYAMLHADKPTEDDWRVVSDALNLMETCIELGWVQDEAGLLQDATKAMAAAGHRAIEGKAIRLDGPGHQAVRAVLQDYETLLRAASERNMKTAHNLTEKRIYEIRHGRRRSHDVTIETVKLNIKTVKL